MNDGSTDNSLDILRKYAQKDDRIKIINQENKGLGATRKVGLDNASGEYISFIDSDDFYEFSALELLYNNALSNNSDVVLFKSAEFYGDKQIKYYSYPRYNIDKQYNKDFNNFSFDYHYLKDDLFHNSFSACLKFYNKDFLNRYSFSFLEHIRYEDVPLHIEVLLRAKLSFCPYYLYNYRKDNSSSIMNTPTDEKTKDIFKIIDIVENFLKEEGYYEELKNDFEKFKVTQISQYLIPSNSESYFLEAKTRLGHIKENFYLNNKIRIIYESVLSSNSIQEVKQKFESTFSEHKPRISVIVPVYNVEKYLKECLDSILNQTFEDIEIICINDGSTDNSLKILLDYIKQDYRLKVYSQYNKGQGSTRNVGLNLASGEYIYFVDSDDFIKDNTLELCYNLLNKENLDMLIFQAINYDDIQKKFFEESYYNMDFLYGFENKVFNVDSISGKLFSIAVSPWNKIYKKEIILKNNIIFSEGLIFEDNEFFFDAFLSSKRVSFLKKHLYARRRREDSTTALGNEKYMDCISIPNRVMNIFKKHNLYEEFKTELFNYKISMINTWFNRTKRKYREQFFNKIKQDFLNIKNNPVLFEEYNSKLWDKNIIVFKNILSSNDYNEFDLLNEISNLKYKCNSLEDKYNSLKDDYVTINRNINLLKKENFHLKDQNRYFKMKNRLLEEKFNSNKFIKKFFLK